jgi:hypothetical protein
MPARLTSPLPLRLAALFAGSLLAVACAATPGEEDDDIGQDEAEQTSVPTAWYRVRAAENDALAVEPVTGGTMRCAAGDESPRCTVAFVDVKRAGISPEVGEEARARIGNLAKEDAVMVLGRAAVRTTGAGEQQKKSLRLLATRVYENVARASADGELYEITKLPTPAPCRLTRSIPSPRGALAAPLLEGFDGTCAHQARKIGSSDAFAIDKPEWRTDMGPLAAPVVAGLDEDLAQGNGVVVVGRLVSSDGPMSRPRPAQVWRDMKRSLSR